jgi:plasmid replication initiation protein
MVAARRLSCVPFRHTTQQGSSPVTGQLDLDFSNDSPLCGAAKNERTLMAFNFFSLTREHQTELPRYDDGRHTIEVKGTSDGVANIWDKELLIYLESLMQERMNRGEVMSRTFRFTGHDFFRITGTKPAGSAYQRLEDSLTRLKSTTIKTNLLDDDGMGGRTQAFSWIDDFSIKWRKTKNGEKSMQAVSVEMGSRLYNAIINNKRMLTYDSRYFQLKPLEKRLYEIARAHVGEQPGFKMGIEKLRLRVGWTSELRSFKAHLLKISERRNQLPGYAISLVDPRIQRSLDAKKQKPTGRTPLKSYLVYFYRTDKLNALLPIERVPTLEELGDDL